ncbi:MAG TPA: hypothetical protein DDW49_09295 [Deltaproteobacteria bacterium]|nr:MAG: hypothetical protein A2048_01750 [Deltaproteobacteria bacterium GWA2_45_12]HBF13556.1 hypothetical protein [Deltaproteobacteria bacterium]
MAAQQPKSNPSPKQSMGYPTMEKLLETEDFTQLNQSFKSCYETLERMFKSKAGGGLGKQKQIRQALQAYELTTDLIKYLLEVKKRMVEAAKSSQPSEIKR